MNKMDCMKCEVFKESAARIRAKLALMKTGLTNIEGDW